MQDEYGRPLSDDGQWVWDGAAWRPTGAGTPPEPATTGYEQTQIAPRDVYPGVSSGPQEYYAQQPGYGGPGGAGGPGGPAGVPPQQETPWWKRPVTVIGALLVLSAVLVTIILLTRGDDSDNGTNPTPSPTSASPTPSPTTEPSVTPTSASPSPTPTPTQTIAPPAQVAAGLYDCTQDGSEFGTVAFAGLTYTTSTGAAGTYNYDQDTGEITFTGGDLGPYTGTYDPTGPSMDLSSSGVQLHCAM